MNPQPPRRHAEISLDIALRLYAVRRPLQVKNLARNADIDLLSDCVEDARDLVHGLNGEPEVHN